MFVLTQLTHIPPSPGNVRMFWSPDFNSLGFNGLTRTTTLILSPSIPSPSSPVVPPLPALSVSDLIDPFIDLAKELALPGLKINKETTVANIFPISIAITSWSYGILDVTYPLLFGEDGKVLWPVWTLPPLPELPPFLITTTFPPFWACCEWDVVLLLDAEEPFWRIFDDDLGIFIVFVYIYQTHYIRDMLHNNMRTSKHNDIYLQKVINTMFGVFVNNILQLPNNHFNS